MVVRYNKSGVESQELMNSDDKHIHEDHGNLEIDEDVDVDTSYILTSDGFTVISNGGTEAQACNAKTIIENINFFVIIYSKFSVINYTYLKY